MGKAIGRKQAFHCKMAELNKLLWLQNIKWLAACRCASFFGLDLAYPSNEILIRLVYRPGWDAFMQSLLYRRRIGEELTN